MPALHLDGFELVVVDFDVHALVDFVAPALVLGFDRLARPFVDQLLAQTVAGLLVDLPKRDALGRGSGGTERDRTRDERELEITFPICTRRHDHTPS
jgi:hypothetical protein